MMKKKKSLNINPYILLFSVIAVCGLLSYFVPAGSFERQVVDGKTMVVANSYKTIEASHASIIDIFRAVPYGFIGAAPIIAIILIIGGTLKIYDKTEAIPLAIYKLISRLGTKSSNLLIIAFYLIFALLGGFLGWIETMLPFTPLVVAIMLALGLDSLVAVSIVIVGMMAGFCAGPTNVLTVGIAQQISELPLFSGFSLRFAVWIIFLVGSLAYILAYANKIKKDPSKSLVADIDTSDLKYDFSTYEGKKLNSGQTLSLFALLGAFLLSLYGMFKLKWNINDMTAVFLLCGVVAGLLNKMNGNEIVNSLIEGAKSAMGGALIVGIARGVQWILETTHIVDTIINAMANALSNTSTLTAGIGIIIAVSLLNGLVPSGSGKAMALIPLIIPLGDLIGLNRQITTLCYQFGDGITNMVWFTYGSLLMFLSYGKVPYNKYLKFVAPLIIFFFIVAIGALYVAVKINYGPF